MKDTDLNPASNVNQVTDTTIVDVLTSLGEEKKTLVSVTLVGTLLFVIVAFLVPRYYQGTTTVLPPLQNQSGALSALSQLGALAGMSGGGMKQPDELYAALLKSTTVQDALIKRFSLKERYAADTLDTTRKALADNSSILTDKKTGLITVQFNDKEAQMAADVANAYIEELTKLSDSLAVSEAQQRRKFFEIEVERTKKRLADAEKAFREIQSQGGMVVSEALAESSVRAGAELRAQIAAKEVQLESLNRFTTAQNPETQRAAAELGALRLQLKKTEEGGPSAESAGRGMDAVAAFRNVKIQTAALEMLVKQLEIAKIDESKEGPMIQQVDVAMVPEKPAKPRRFLIAALGGVFSGLIGVIAALLRASLRKASGEDAAKLARLRGAWLQR